MCIQAYNEILNNIIDANEGKSVFISVANGFMKLVRQRNNPNKKTLIYIPYCLMESLTEHIQPELTQTATNLNFEIIRETLALGRSYLGLVARRIIIELVTIRN